MLIREKLCRKRRLKGKMHEYPITQQIIKICEKQCKEAEAAAVKSVHLVVGERSGYVAESVKMYFDIISEGTACHGAEIVITQTRSKLRCPSCGELFERELLSFACPKCGTDGEPTDIGREFYVDYIEVE